MPGVKRCLGLDLGSHSVKLAEMAIEGDSVRVVRMLSAPVPVGPAAVEEERNAAIVAAVRGLIKQNKISTRKAVFGMPGQTVFVRRIRLPQAPRPRLHQIVHFEARQLIPFPLEKTLLQYQVFNTEDEREVEVLLVAMKKETNLEFMRLVRRIGLKPIGISVTTLALFNGQELSRFRMSEWREKSGAKGGPLKMVGGKGKKRKGAAAEDAGEELDIIAGSGFEEIRAYVNLGARSTDIAICKTGKSEAVGFTRSIPLGGSHVTAAIQKASNLETFTQAETLKIEKTAVLSGAYELEADPERYDQAASQAATKVCDRIIAEIRRSLDYYISQPDGMAVDLIVLSGGASRMPFLAGYIEERLGLPVEISKDLNSRDLKRAAQYEDFDYASHMVAIGLASQGLGISPITVDFIPRDIATMRDFSTQYVEMVVLGAFIGAMIFFSMQLGSSSRGVYNQQADEAQRKIEEMRPRIDLKNSVEQNRVAVQSKLDILSPFVIERDYWLKVLRAIQGAKPVGVLVTGLICLPDYINPAKGSVIIMGEAEVQGAIPVFVRSIQRNSELFEVPTLGQPTRARSAFFNRDVWRFRIQIVAKAPEGRQLTRLLSAPRVATPTPTPATAGPMFGPEMGPEFMVP